ncbi:hypothetical protein N431DRAFT_433224 [Stipitochalara longipes BDJ]|nr:hypothetical protein N431DRAFT_433224 [Stipitochalara longipes BDJ]
MVYLKSALLTAALGLLTTTLATPTLIVPRQNTTTYTTIWQAIVGGGCGDGFNTGDSNLVSGACNKFLAESYYIFPLPNVNCSFTTYNSNTCANGTADTNPPQPYLLPAGGSKVCVYGGAYDGGLHTERSGRLDCA